MGGWLKYHSIKLIGLITGKTAVRFMGASYLISGNVVKRFGQ
jgi:hypothetical protein